MIATDGVVSTTNEARRPLRRSIASARLRTIRVQVDDATAERLQELSDRYEVARGTIARAAIEAGMKAVIEQLRRAARRDARDRGAEGAREAAEATP